MTRSSADTAPKKRKKLLFVCSEDWYFVSHRLALARAAQVRGWEIVIACRANAAAEGLREEGFRVIDLKIARGGLSPVSSLGTIINLVSIIRREKPVIVFNIAIQCVVLASIATTLAGFIKTVNLVTGLGSTFVATGQKSRLVRKAIGAILWIMSKRRSVHVIVQNRDDAELIQDYGFVLSRLTVILGSGVDTAIFFPRQSASTGADVNAVTVTNKVLATHRDTEGCPHRLTAIFVARMLWAKGVGDVVAAAKMLREKGRNYRFLLVGSADAFNADKVDSSQLQKWHDEGVVEWLGRRSDIVELFQQSDVALLPSYYREGVPKALLEAASCGLPLIACDVPGSREIVRDGDTGFLIPARDQKALAQAIETLMEDVHLRKEMGNNARQMIVEDLSDQKIVAKTMAVIEDLLG
ncbi:glycosyltransferase family 4 protein [uncultured Thalassospira sp.]|uniref:glycosyltransferase family 4 protein n=1 Tax=uncultured Thalassospira sp. TaxID=404382 RepID=UPI0030D7DBA4|tara:strand:- start:1356 stop:2588 length:1233 start_codon:yes stop_codon:yes gene_type:complete